VPAYWFDIVLQSLDQSNHGRHSRQHLSAPDRKSLSRNDTSTVSDGSQLEAARCSTSLEVGL